MQFFLISCIAFLRVFYPSVSLPELLALKSYVIYLFADMISRVWREKGFRISESSIVEGPSFLCDESWKKRKKNMKKMYHFQW